MELGRLAPIGASLVAILQVSASPDVRAATANDTQTEAFVCPVTRVNDGKGGLYGSDRLSVALWRENKFVFAPDGPGFIDRDGGLGIKVGWWRDQKGLLQIQGRRLDGAAAPARAYISDYGDTGLQPIYLVFPTPGCWEITGSVGQASLTFVTLVEKIGDGPRSHLSGPPRGWRVSQ